MEYMKQFFTESKDETLQAGIEFSQELNPGDIVFLIGQLGSGKTLFSQGVARGLEVEENVTSPTFSIVEPYASGKLPFYHFDLYRIEDPGELENLFFDDYWYGEGVSLIEWPDKGGSRTPEPTYRVTFQITSETERIITIERITG
jgi:tRNA threonylcarbamoyladenosine biosynthesis protein TsaE